MLGFRISHLLWSGSGGLLKSRVANLESRVSNLKSHVVKSCVSNLALRVSNRTGMDLSSLK